MSDQRAIPHSLRQAGVTRLSDNLGDRQVQLPRGLIMQFFGRELQARFLVERGVEHARSDITETE